MKNFRIEIKWAIIFAIASILWMVIEKMAGLHDEHIDKQTQYSFLFAIPAIVIYFLALTEKRDKFFSGKMSWQQGFVSGLFLSLFEAVLSLGSNYICYTVISPEYFPNMIKYLVNTQNRSEAVAMVDFNLQSAVKRGVVDAMSMGVITSALVALVVKTKPSKL